VDWLAPVWPLIAESTHIWLLLTKRPHRMAEFLAGYGCPDNVWPGTSITSMGNISRLDELAKIDSPHRWVSREPMLGPLDVSRINPAAVRWWAVSGNERSADGGDPPKEFVGRDAFSTTTVHWLPPSAASGNPTI
jgi:protein gp37